VCAVVYSPSRSLRSPWFTAPRVAFETLEVIRFSAASAAGHLPSPLARPPRRTLGTRAAQPNRRAGQPEAQVFLAQSTQAPHLHTTCTRRSPKQSSSCLPAFSIAKRLRIKRKRYPKASAALMHRRESRRALRRAPRIFEVYGRRGPEPLNATGSAPGATRAGSAPRPAAARNGEYLSRHRRASTADKEQAR